MRSASRTLSSQPAPSPRRRPVTAALDASVTCSAPSERCHASQRVDGAEAEVAGAVGVGLVEEVGELGGRRVGGDADAVGLQHEAGADGAQVLPPEPGADGLARGPVPHDRGGPLVGDAHRVDGPDLGEHGPASSSATRAISAASNSTSPGRGSPGAAARGARRPRWRPGARRLPAARSCRRRSRGSSWARSTSLAGGEDGCGGRRARSPTRGDGRDRGPGDVVVRPPTDGRCRAPARRRSRSARRPRRAERERATARRPTRSPPTAIPAEHHQHERVGEHARVVVVTASRTCASSAAGTATARANPAPPDDRRPRPAVGHQ